MQQNREKRSKRAMAESLGLGRGRRGVVKVTHRVGEGGLTEEEWPRGRDVKANDTDLPHALG